METSSPAPTNPRCAHPRWARTLAMLAGSGLTGCVTTPDPLASAATLAPFPALQAAAVESGGPRSAPAVATTTMAHPLADPAPRAWDDRVPADGDTDFAAGVGFSGSPNTFLLGAQLDYYVEDEWALGAVLQIGASDKDWLLAPSFNVKRIFEPRLMAEHEAQPFLQGGVGFVLMDEEGSPSDSGLMINLGGGAEMFVEDDMTLRTTLMVNYLPGKVLGTSWFFSWQVLQVQFRF